MKPNNKTQLSTSCGAVIWRLDSDGDVSFLLIKQFAHKDAWGIPKGHTKEGEDNVQCALREVKEEAGVDVVLGKQLTSVQSKYKNEYKEVVAFLAQQVGNEPPRCDDPDSEVVDVRWFKLTEMPRIHIYQRPLLDEAVRRLRPLLDRGDFAPGSGELHVHGTSDAADIDYFRTKLRNAWEAE